MILFGLVTLLSLSAASVVEACSASGMLYEAMTHRDDSSYLVVKDVVMTEIAPNEVWGENPHAIEAAIGSVYCDQHGKDFTIRGNVVDTVWGPTTTHSWNQTFMGGGANPKVYHHARYHAREIHADPSHVTFAENLWDYTDPWWTGDEEPTGENDHAG
jgi:hypothetical protein